MVGNVATYTGAGQINVCERVYNASTGQTHETCGLNGAGNALNVHTWFGDSLHAGVRNGSSQTHTINGYWYYSAEYLGGGDELSPGQHMDSDNGKYRLSMQVDGNLVIYKLSSGKACWSSGTQGNPGAWLAMQPDGNFVIYKGGGGPALFNTGTNGNWSSVAIMQGDGNLTIYSDGNNVLWASNTSGC